MIETILSLLDKYGITFDNNCRVFVDGANPSFVRALKNRIIGEDSNYKPFIARLKTRYGPVRFNLESLMHNMFVVPVHFNKEHKSMLAHCKQMMEYNNGNVAIHPRFNKLITALMTAVENGEGVLDKEATSHDDVFDAFRMSLQFWH